MLTPCSEVDRQHGQRAALTAAAADDRNQLRDALQRLSFTSSKLHEQCTLFGRKGLAHRRDQ